MTEILYQLTDSESNMALSEIKKISVDLLSGHPDNRAVTGLDEKRIERLVEYIKRDGGFSMEYPLSVRPVSDGSFQIVAGHHRAEAARQLGIKEVPCVVRELGDLEALVRMITSNDQRDNNPLDIGSAAKAACRRYDKEMSLRRFAELVGSTEQYVGQLVSASNVAEYVKARKNKVNFNFRDFKNKSQHLAEISRAPIQSWLPLVNLLAAKENTVSKVKNHVKLIKQLIDAVPDFMLPPIEMIKDENGIDVKDTTERDSYISSLAEIAIRSQAEASKRIAVFKEVESLGNKLNIINRATYRRTDEIILHNNLPHHVEKLEVDSVDLRHAFVLAIRDFPTVPSIDRVHSIFNSVKTRYVEFNENMPETNLVCVLSNEEIERQLMDLRKNELEHLKQLRSGKITHGDCIDYLTSWQGKRIKLVLTDPPYGMAFQSNRRTVSEKTKLIENDLTIEQALDIFAESLDAMIPHLAEDAHLIVFCNDDHEPDFRNLIISKGFQFKRLLVWVKPNHGTGDLFGAFAPRKELMIHAVKGRPEVSPRIDDVFIQESKESTSHHPTEKPVSVLKKIIESTTIESEMVVDPFAGVGSTLVAAVELNRDCWGAELDDSYFAKAQSRLIETVKED